MSELYHETDVGEYMPTAVKALNEEGTRLQALGYFDNILTKGAVS
jgi:hypothetical protein